MKSSLNPNATSTAYKKAVFWIINILSSHGNIETGLKCFILVLMMSLSKSKKLANLRAPVKPLPRNYVARVLKKRCLDRNRVLCVPPGLATELQLVNFQWVSLKPSSSHLTLGATAGFPCQILILSIPDQASVLPDLTSFYMTPTALHNLRAKFGMKSFFPFDISVYITPLMLNSNEYTSVALSIFPSKSAQISKLSSPDKELSSSNLDLLLRSYFGETKLVAAGDLIDCSDSEGSVYFLVNSVETDELVNKDFLALFSISTSSTSLYLQDKEINSLKPCKTHRLITSGGATLNVVPTCPPLLQTSLDAMRNSWIRSFSSLRSTLEKNHGSSSSSREKHELWPTCLLTGIMGSGKYTLVKALAASLGMNFYSVNMLSLIGDTSAFTIAKLTALLHKVQGFSPCVLLIKNIHLLGKDKEGQEDKRLILAFTELLDELNRLHESNPETELFLVGETHRIEEVLPSIMDCLVYKQTIEPVKSTEEIVSYFRWKEDLHPQLKLQFELEKWITANNVKTSFKYLGDLEALLSVAVRTAYMETLMLRHGDVVSPMVWDDIPSSTTDHQPLVLAETHFDAALEHMEATIRTAVGSPKVPQVSWDDVGGLGEVKKELINSVQLPLRFPHLFASGIKRSGILLYGPPGTGKTLLAKAVASEFKINFFSVKGPELLNMYVGQSEQNVREVFDKARECSPCVLFFDELDSLAPNRGRSGDSGGVMDRVVSQILAEMDGTHSTPNVFIIGATNRPDLIDPALLRPGRFDKLIYVGISAGPDITESILKSLTRKFTLGSDVDLDDISKKLPPELSGADLYSFCSDSYMIAVTRRIQLLETGESEDQDSPVTVNSEDFYQAISRVIPSLSQQELGKYQQLKSLMR